VRIGLLAALLAAVGLGAAVGRAAPPPTASEPVGARELLYPLGADQPLAAALAEPARLTLVYWPPTPRCSTLALPLEQALRRFAEDYPDTRILSVVQEGAGGVAAAEGGLPGRTVRLVPHAYRRHAALVPPPRLEVWVEEHGLLLLKTLPQVPFNPLTTIGELEDFRAVTRPLAGLATPPLAPLP
jgi:hypothetical protein